MRAMFAAAVAAALLATPALAQDVAPGTPTFSEGDVIGFDQIDQLKSFLPPEFWANRDFFFYEGMQLEIGPFFKDYSPADEYKAATQKYSANVKLGSMERSKRRR